MLTLLLLLLPTASAADVVVFGDSWAYGGGDELADALHAANLGFSVENLGVSGTTATFWTQTNALADAVTLNPDAKWVWLSILGNDTFGYHASGQGSTSATSNETQLRQLLAGLHAAHPDVQVVGFPYDYVNFEQSTDCLVSGALYFPDLIAAGTFSSYSINRIFETEVGDVLARVDADDVRYTTYPMWGTLQADAGTVGAPNVYLPSPASRMSDCIHPTSHGFRVILDRLVADYWGHARPIAAVQGAPSGPVCVGVSVPLVSASTHADAVEWTVDGTAVSTDASVSWLADAVGAHTARLRAYGGAWHDDVELPLEVVDPPTIAVSDAVEICRGASTTLSAAGGATVSWSPSEGLDTTDAFDPQASPEDTTTYTAMVSSADGCDASATVTVTVLDVPAVSIDGPATVPAGEPAAFNATTDGEPVVWSADDGAEVTVNGAMATVIWSTVGEHTVHASSTGEDGCSATATWAVTVVSADAIDSDASDTDGMTTDDFVARPRVCGCDGAREPGLGTVAVLAGVLVQRRRRIRS